MQRIMQKNGDPLNRFSSRIASATNCEKPNVLRETSRMMEDEATAHDAEEQMQNREKLEHREHSQPMPEFREDRID